MNAAADRRFMALALSLGRRGLGRVWPNPAVGCVVVNDGQIVGRGHTGRGGRPHAEPQALAQAGAAAKGATVYVSLEPCAHQGVTAPCTDALIAAGVSRVVTARTDPDPRVGGAGLDQLRAAGITIQNGVLADEAGHDQVGFLTRVTRNRPMLTLKLATSFDGRIATASGQSRWITGAAARRAVHGLRMTHDAVLIGGGTARVDDPMLTVRELGVSHQPVRIVASRHMNLPHDGRLAGSAAQIPLWMAHGDRPGDVGPADISAWQSLGATCLPVGVSASGQLDAQALLTALGGLGLTRVFCEGGGAFAASLLIADLVDELVGFTAGLILGAEGQPALGALGVSDLAAAPRFRLAETRAIGADVMHRWVRETPAWAVAKAP